MQIRLFLGEFCGSGNWARGRLQLPLGLCGHTWALGKRGQAQTPAVLNTATGGCLTDPALRSLVWDSAAVPSVLAVVWEALFRAFPFASTQIGIKRCIMF